MRAARRGFAARVRPSRKNTQESRSGDAFCGQLIAACYRKKTRPALPDGFL
jgi:hypothetical protein